MATLIGRGAHAADIMCSVEEGTFTKSFSHHSEWDGSMPVVIGINDPQLRAKVAQEMGVVDLGWNSPYVIFGHDYEIDYGTHINYGAKLTRCKIGHHCTISPGVTICGDVLIGDRVLVGAGATICDRVAIGNDVTIGAGAVVLPETTIPDGETWVGVPARTTRLKGLSEQIAEATSVDQMPPLAWGPRP